MNGFCDEAILGAWRENAAPWIEAVRSGSIESRRLVTDHAIVSAIRRLQPATVLDVGCGEGWLARALAPLGMQVHGIDAVPELVAAARLAGGGTFECLSYEAFAEGAPVTPAALAVCNFSLLGDEATRGVIRRLGSLLPPHGNLLIQTLHPGFAVTDAERAEGWRAGSWAGCGDAFGRAAPWYFRTLAGWLALLQEAGFQLRAMHEPRHPLTGVPCSVIFEAAIVPERDH
ncbi:class I SAM-dependent methyltransferase [Dyella agri]|uniref:Methyltransferase domain-containing protein n=1 Tax=Dyella agri TaxID=1926869 RepID=A0ABW8KC29_9GAMM